MYPVDVEHIAIAICQPTGGITSIVNTISNQTKNYSNDLAFKAKIIENTKQNGNYSTVKQLGIDHKRIIEWRRQKEDIAKQLKKAGKKTIVNDESWVTKEES